MRLHPGDFPTRILLTLAGEQGTWNGTLNLPKGRLMLDEIRSVWWRRPEPSILPKGLSVDEQAFARRETEEALTGLWESISCYWMSFPSNIRRASNKIEQLQHAASLGFRIPRTLVTNDPDEIQAFYEICGGQIIYKPLAGFYLPSRNSGEAPRLLRTSLITSNHLKNFEGVRQAPCLFQELIPKRMELRVTIVGDEIFTAEIHSQEHDRTKIDWRHYEIDIPYKKGLLPSAIAGKCFAMTKHYGLHYSAFDLILTPEGEYVFLENNPNGQSFFIQERIPELKIMEAVIECLLRGNA